MRLSFFQVDPSDDVMVNLSLDLLRNVTASVMTPDELRLRMGEPLAVPSSGPSGLDRSMFEVWLGCDLDDSRKIKVGVFLDRTLDRPIHANPNSRPRRDWWCISLGLDAAVTVADSASVYDGIKTWLKSQVYFKGRTFAVVWEANAVLNNTKPVDAIFDKFKLDVEAPGSMTKIFANDGHRRMKFSLIPQENKYRHFGNPAEYIKMARIEFI